LNWRSWNRSWQYICLWVVFNVNILSISWEEGKTVIINRCYPWKLIFPNSDMISLEISPLSLSPNWIWHFFWYKWENTFISLWFFVFYWHCDFIFMNKIRVPRESNLWSFLPLWKSCHFTKKHLINMLYFVLTLCYYFITWFYRITSPFNTVSLLQIWWLFSFESHWHFVA